MMQGKIEIVAAERPRPVRGRYGRTEPAIGVARRCRRRAWLIVPLAALVGAVAPAAAQARNSLTMSAPGPDGTSLVVFDTTDDGVQRVEVSSFSDGTIVFEDAAETEGWFTGPNCRVIGPDFLTRASCGGPGLPRVASYRAELGAGDDSFRIKTTRLRSGLAFGEEGSDTVVGGPGGERFVGDSGNDHLNGGLGDDKIDGGTGTDILSGSFGDDTVISREPESAGVAERDELFCGDGLDLAVMDLMDVSHQCDHRRIAAIDEGGVVSILNQALRRQHGKIEIRLGCPPAAKTPCEGRLAIEKRNRALGSTRYAIGKGRKATVRIAIRKARGTLVVRAREKDSKGRPKTSEATLALRSP